MTFASPAAQQTGTNLSTRQDREQRPAFGVRIAEISALMPNGNVVAGQRKVPILPEFDNAFSAFAQGTVFKSDAGFVAIEDLSPGDRLMTVGGDSVQVMWIGSALFSPMDARNRTRLVRVMADSFGMNRPDSSVSFGAGARLLHTPPDLRNSTVAARLMTPANRFLDSVNVIEILPPTPVRMFHFALRRHAAVQANGLAVESYHPGTTPVSHMSQTLKEAFTGLFPHIGDLTEFGPMRYARAPGAQELAGHV